MSSQASIDLWNACTDGDLNKVIQSLEEGADILFRHGPANTAPIMRALSHSQAKVSQYLLDRYGSDSEVMRQVSSEGGTPLSQACISSPGYMVKKVAAYDVSQLNRKDILGNTPLLAGVDWNNLSSVRILLTQVDNVDYECKTNLGRNIEEYAR